MKKVLKITYVVLSVCILTFAFLFQNVISVKAADYTLNGSVGGKYKSGDTVRLSTEYTYGLHYFDFFVNDKLVEENVPFYYNDDFQDDIPYFNGTKVSLNSFTMPYVNGTKVEWELRNVDDHVFPANIYYGNRSYGDKFQFYATYDEYNLHIGCNSESLKVDGKSKCGISFTFGNKLDTNVKNYQLDLNKISYKLDSSIVNISNYKSDFVYSYNKDKKTYIYDVSKQTQTPTPAAAVTLDTLPGTILGTFDVSYDGNEEELSNLSNLDSLIKVSEVSISYVTPLGDSIDDDVDDAEVIISLDKKEEVPKTVDENPPTGVINYLLLLIPVGVLIVGFILIKTRKKTFKNN